MSTANRIKLCVLLFFRGRGRVASTANQIKPYFFSFRWGVFNLSRVSQRRAASQPDVAGLVATPASPRVSLRAFFRLVLSPLGGRRRGEGQAAGLNLAAGDSCHTKQSNPTEQIDAQNANYCPRVRRQSLAGRPSSDQSQLPAGQRIPTHLHVACLSQPH